MTTPCAPANATNGGRRLAHSVRERRQSPTEVASFIDIEGLAAWLGISVRHVRRLVADKRVPFLKVGNLIRFDPADIGLWINHQKEASGSQ